MEWFRLEATGVRRGTQRILLKRFENYEDIFKLGKSYLTMAMKIDNEEVEKIYLSKDIDLLSELKKLENSGIGVLFLKSKNYPVELKNIAHPPIFIYYKGNIDLLKGRKIAVVGTRKATTYGKITCEKFVRELVENSITTVSGLALGIDGVCHKITLDNNGKTIAVVGSGLVMIYPSRNEKLWKRIERNGLLLSEFPLGTEPFNYNFPLRNRIIVGLSRGVLVVESQKKGGSLITAELALEEGRDVFAVPGDIFSPCSEGTNMLIKNSQAKLVSDVNDILSEYGWESDKLDITKKLNLTEHEIKIYNVLDREKNLDEIILESSMKAGEILSILMELEVKKIICSVPGGKYRRRV